MALPWRMIAEAALSLPRHGDTTYVTPNAFVAPAVTAVPRLKLREAEQYFKLRKQKDRTSKDSDPKRQ